MTSLFFATIFLFLCLPFLLGKLFKIEKFFPPVFLQIVFGFVLSESGMVNWLKTKDVDLSSGVLSTSVGGLGWFGLAVIIALVGGESAPASSDRKPWRFVPISLSGFFFTCIFGSVIGWQLIRFYPDIVGSHATPLRSALTLGLTLAVTALPVLISILRDTGLAGTRVGSLAVNCAMLDDVWMWLGIALLLSFGQSSAHLLMMFICLAAYLGFMFLVLKPLLQRWYATRTDVNYPGAVLGFVLVICFSAMMTDLIGLHPLLGAFIAGVIYPAKIMAAWRDSLISFTQILLLPFYFIQTGMRLHFDLNDGALWLLAAIVTSIAVLSKFASVTLSARCTGLSWRDSAMLGSLMQCKGLMELVAINIFFEAGMIGAKIYAALAMMALISTLLTAPAIHWFGRQPRPLLSRATGLPSV